MAQRKRNDISLQFPCLSPGGRAIKHVGGRRQYPVPNTIVSYNLDTSSWSSFSLQPGPSTPLDPAAGPPPFDQALINGNRMTLFSHPLLKAFHVNSRCDGVNMYIKLFSYLITWSCHPAEGRCYPRGQKWLCWCWWITSGDGLIIEALVEMIGMGGNDWRIDASSTGSIEVYLDIWPR